MGKLIMLVDDSASLRQIVGIALKSAGYDVLEACDGRDALKKLTGQKVHLIVSDVNMPNMDGISMVKEIKKLPNYKFTPIMMLTTESDQEKKMQGKAAGAKAWLVKPFQPPMLLDAVSKLVLP
jgi:two-component system chemotaxis response regulator CheY